MTKFDSPRADWPASRVWQRCLLFGLMLSLVCLGKLPARAKDDDDAPAKSSAPKSTPKAIPADAKEALDGAGLKVVGGNLTLAGEGELNKMFTDVAKQKKALIGAERDYHGVESEVDGIKTELRELKAKHIQLSAQLSAAAGNVALNNRIVGEANAVAGQIDLGREEEKKADERLKAAVGKASEARESYIELLLSMRALATGISDKWKELADDPALQEAVTAASEATGKKLKLAPSPSFIAAEKKLQALEHTILSEAIPMTNDGGSLTVSVTLNGKHRFDMAVDSGATDISLPYALAKQIGIEPKSSDQKIVVGLADGREVPATLSKISSVRVGKFTVEDVECVILDAKAVNAPALLGMSFLGNFTFEIDKQKSELRMVKVEAGDSSSKSKSAAGKGKPGKSKPSVGKSKQPADSD